MGDAAAVGGVILLFNYRLGERERENGKSRRRSPCSEQFPHLDDQHLGPSAGA